MELYRDILYRILEFEEFEILLPKWKMNVEEMMEMKCYQALQEIKKILEDDELDDAECFESIEKIICVFEKLGSGINERHDFG
ncbi:hypothetical protein [Anaerotignum sp.]|nr:hypothetical protein [Anaerotignum sp.]MBQ7757813.1 hypothetical protein [Anaerotignum sp.]